MQLGAIGSVAETVADYGEADRVGRLEGDPGAALPSEVPHKRRPETEELFELKAHIKEGLYAEALQLIEEMEEMSKDDKINKIYSLAVVLLLHLIKKHAERRTTRSWNTPSGTLAARYSV